MARRTTWVAHESLQLKMEAFGCLPGKRLESQVLRGRVRHFNIIMGLSSHPRSSAIAQTIDSRHTVTVYEYCDCHKLGLGNAVGFNTTRTKPVLFSLLIAGTTHGC